MWLLFDTSTVSFKRGVILQNRVYGVTMGLCGQSDHQNGQNATLFHLVTIWHPCREESYYKVVILGFPCSYGVHLTTKIHKMRHSFFDFNLAHFQWIFVRGLYRLFGGPQNPTRVQEKRLCQVTFFQEKTLQLNITVKDCKVISSLTFSWTS